MHTFSLVTTTCANAEEAQKLADSIIRARLAACVHLAPIQSVYWWQGEIEHGNEVTLQCKTRQALVQQLTRHILANHSYVTPAVVELPILSGAPDYLNWINNTTRSSQ